ncbi:hypothetical protein HYW83_05365 [Candidatus Peregrinibacteria bacterium]|nr:hypothetical protein [Candidatus Peregrinibacteria bacterium]
MHSPDDRDPLVMPMMAARPLEDEENLRSRFAREFFSRKWLIRFALIAFGFIGGRLSACRQAPQPQPDSFLEEKVRITTEERKLCEHEVTYLRPLLERIRARNSSDVIPDCHAAFIDLMLTKHGLGALEHAFRYTACASAELGSIEVDVMTASLEFARLCEK